MPIIDGFETVKLVKEKYKQFNDGNSEVVEQEDRHSHEEEEE